MGFWKNYYKFVKYQHILFWKSQRNVGDGVSKWETAILTCFMLYALPIFGSQTFQDSLKNSIRQGVIPTPWDEEMLGIEVGSVHNLHDATYNVNWL